MIKRLSFSFELGNCIICFQNRWTEEEPSDEKILLIGADLKHVLRTVAGSIDFKGSFQFVLADPNPHIQARNLVLLGLLLNQEKARTI